VILITGCELTFATNWISPVFNYITVVQHCINGDTNSSEKGQIKTPERSKIKFGTVDCAPRNLSQTELGDIGLVEASGKYVK